MRDSTEQRPTMLAAFVAAYPDRPEGIDHDKTRAAWDRALDDGVDPLDLVAAAIAYRREMDGRPSRYVMAPARWLTEGRWRAFERAATSPAPFVWIALDAPGWKEWAAFYRVTRGKTPPQDRRGGWRFPSRLPPSIMQAAE